MIAVVVVVILLTTKNIIMIYPPVTKYNCIYTMHTYTYNISGRLKQIYKNLMHIFTSDPNKLWNLSNSEIAAS